MFPEPDSDLETCCELQFAEDVAHVGLHGVLADDQRFSNLGGAFASDDSLHDLLLTLSEALPARAYAPISGRSAVQLLACAQPLPLDHATDGFDEPLGYFLFGVSSDN